ncbi:MAG: hypothetical protein ACMZ63_01165 [Methylotenera sp.]
MKISMVVALLISSVFSFPVYAGETDFKQYLNKPYSQVRESLISEGWQVVPNKKINDTSLYAQSVYEKGYQEVVDCVSMERDQCQFVLSKNKQLILVTTKEKSLNVESMELNN